MKEKEQNLKLPAKEKRLQKWKEHFKNLLRNPADITNKPAKRIINIQLDIKPRQFIQEEAVLEKIKSKKAAGLNETSPEI